MVGREREEGQAVARGALDEFSLFRRYANVACCDITEDVELGCKHIQGSRRTHYGRFEGAHPRNFE